MSKKETIVISDSDAFTKAEYDRDSLILDVEYRNGKVDHFPETTSAMFSQFVNAAEMGQSFIRQLRHTRDLRESLEAHRG